MVGDGENWGCRWLSDTRRTHVPCRESTALSPPPQVSHRKILILDDTEGEAWVGARVRARTSSLKLILEKQKRRAGSKEGSIPRWA